MEITEGVGTMNKRGMEMWQLVLIIIALLLLFAVLAWYSGLNKELATLLGRLDTLT